MRSNVICRNVARCHFNWISCNRLPFSLYVWYASVTKAILFLARLHTHTYIDGRNVYQTFRNLIETSTQCMLGEKPTKKFHSIWEKHRDKMPTVWRFHYVWSKETNDTWITDTEWQAITFQNVVCSLKLHSMQMCFNYVGWDSFSLAMSFSVV